jgi:hypothetical protein
MGPTRRTAPRRRPESGMTLWQVIAAPVVWAVHFLASYVWAAIRCEKAGRDAALGSAQTGVLLLTAVALALIGLNTLHLWRVHARSRSEGDFDFDHNTPEERHRFLVHTALMLSVLSAIAVVFVALPAVVVTTCR